MPAIDLAGFVWPDGAAGFQPQQPAGWAPDFAALLPGTALVGGVPQSTDGAVTTVGTVPTVATRAGLASDHTGGGTTTIRRAVIVGSAIGTQITGGALLVVFTSNETTLDLRIAALGSESGTTGNTVFSIGTGSTTASQLRATFGGSASNTGFDYAGTNITDGRIHAALISLDAFYSISIPNGTTYLDGASLGTQALAATSGNSWAFTWIVAGGLRRGGTDIAGAKCRILLAVPFHRAVPDSSARALTARLAAGDWSAVFGERELPMMIPSALVADILLGQACL